MLAGVWLAVEAAAGALPVVVLLVVVVVLATALPVWAALGAVATTGFSVPGFRLGTFSGHGAATTTGAGAGWATTGSGAGSGVSFGEDTRELSG